MPGGVWFGLCLRCGNGHLVGIAANARIENLVAAFARVNAGYFETEYALSVSFYGVVAGLECVAVV